MSQSMIGRIINKRYQVEEFVASGGMKTVYKVRDLERSTHLAMKMLHGDLGEDQAVLKSFKRETSAIKALAHPHIVRFYGMGEVGDTYFMLEEFIDGPSLKDVLKERRVLPVEEALVYFKALCAALGFAHANRVVHCDVKPGNVMIDQGGNILLTDFGIARHASSDSTSTFAGAGTPAYMAPEQIRRDPVTAETDIYALGVVLYEMLTGQRPFKGSEAGLETAGNTQNERIRYAHLMIQPQNPRSLNPRIPGQLAEAVLIALSKNPADRFSDTQTFLRVVCQGAGIPEGSIPTRVAPPRPAAGYGGAGGYENTAGYGQTGSYAGGAPYAGTTNYGVPFGGNAKAGNTPGGAVEPPVSTWEKLWPSKAPYLVLGAAVLIMLAFFIFRKPASPLAGEPAAPPVVGGVSTGSDTNPPPAPNPTDTPAGEWGGKLASWPTNTPPPVALTATPGWGGQIATWPTETPVPAVVNVSTSAEVVLAYAYGPVGDSDVYVSDAAGSFQLKVAGQNCDETEPSASADGQWIVFQENCSGSYNLSVVDAHGGQRFELTNDGALDEREPDWSPDGTQVVYRVNTISDKNKTATGQLHILDYQTRRDVTLNIYGRGPVYSPDGSKIAYMSDQSGTWQIFVYDLQNGSIKQVTNSSSQARWPGWSPDGSSIVYNSASGSASTPDGIWYVPSSGGDPVKVIQNGQHGRPGWSGNGYIIFNTTGVGIQAVKPDGRGLQVIISASAAWAPDWSR